MTKYSIIECEGTEQWALPLTDTKCSAVLSAPLAPGAVSGPRTLAWGAAGEQPASSALGAQVSQPLVASIQPPSWPGLP